MVFMKARSRLKPKAKSRLPKGFVTFTLNPDVRFVEIRNERQNVYHFLTGLLLGTALTYFCISYISPILINRFYKNNSGLFQSTENMCRELPVSESKEKPMGIVGKVEAYEPQNDIEQYIIKVFGQDAGSKGIEMLKECENKSMNPEATNHNRNGSVDRGLWQINSVHGYGEELFDPYFNTDVAYKIYQRAGNSFRPWSCANHAGEIAFWQL